MAAEFDPQAEAEEFLEALSRLDTRDRAKVMGVVRRVVAAAADHDSKFVCEMLDAAFRPLN